MSSSETPTRRTPTSSGGNSTLADLTSCVRRTRGNRPPPLVGCSLTLIDDQVYVFGGRLVPTRTMVSTLYCLSLRTLTWTVLWPPPADEASTSTHDRDETLKDGPAPRYFHSAEAWGKKIVIFGGEGYSFVGADEDLDAAPLCTLDDLCIWDTENKVWEFPRTSCAEGVERPAPRYAHLGVITSFSNYPFTSSAPFRPIDIEKDETSLLIILGGQDINNSYLNSVNVLDLSRMEWSKVGRWGKHIGTYRAVAISARQGISSRGVKGGDYSNGTGMEGPTRAAPIQVSTSETIVHQSHSRQPTIDRPEPIFVFSNYNFAEVRRDLDVLSTPIAPNYDLDTISLSRQMSGTTLPPGLRFPNGTIVGRHLMIFGTYLSQNVNTFAIWSLDLGKDGGAGIGESAALQHSLPWTKIDPGSVLSRGSWNRAVGWGNKLVVLGDRERDIAIDYDHRQTNFAHAVIIDLEAFGIYQPPPQALPPSAQSFGASTFNLRHLCDFELIASDGKRLACSRKLLIDRWAWFRERVEEFKDTAGGIISAQQKRQDARLIESAETIPAMNARSVPNLVLPRKPSAEVRLTPRTLDLPEASLTILAFLQYLHTLSLSTPLQHSLPAITSLLSFSTIYRIDHLRALCVHALHEWLEEESATGSGTVAVYEAATLNSCHSLQIRALKIMMGGARARQVNGNGNGSRATPRTGEDTSRSSSRQQ